MKTITILFLGLTALGQMGLCLIDKENQILHMICAGVFFIAFQLEINHEKD